MLDQSHAVPPDASPSLMARVSAFSAIIVAGACGGLIGFAVTDLSCDDGCTNLAGLVGLGSAVGAAIGTGIVAVLTLRAAAEWKAQQAPVAADPVTGVRRRGGSRPR